MKVIEPGHVYQLQHLDGSGAGILVFVNREDGTEHEGTQTQEVLRVLIDRTQHCDSCLRWSGNDEIIMHLRQALVLHEARALERKTVKGRIEPEKVPTGPDGHFVLGGPEDRRPGLHLNSRGSRRIERLPDEVDALIESGLGKAIGESNCTTLRFRKVANYVTFEIREDQVAALGVALSRWDDVNNIVRLEAELREAKLLLLERSGASRREAVEALDNLVRVKCALQADSCKAADCPEHGFVNRNPKVMRLGAPAKTWVRSRDEVWHAQRDAGVACGARVEPMESRDTPVLGDLVCTTCITLYPTYGTPYSVGSGG